MKVKDIMNRSVCYISPDKTIKEAAQIMKDKDIGILPVAENERLIGMLTDRDVVIYCLAQNKLDGSIKEAMCKKVLYCMEDDSLEDLAKNMGSNQIRRLPVLNQDKRLVGIVSIGDLAKKGAKDLAGEALAKICECN